jgi:hypothetical protein
LLFVAGAQPTTVVAVFFVTDAVTPTALEAASLRPATFPPRRVPLIPCVFTNALKFM